MQPSDADTVLACLLSADFGPDDAEAETLPAPPMSDPSTVKTCGCGRSYDAAGWAALPFVGVMRDDVEASELRNCTACGSTIALAACVAPDCRALATWTHGESGYCSEHINAPLMSEDREDFASEWARDVRREREVAA